MPGDIRSQARRYAGGVFHAERLNRSRSSSAAPKMFRNFGLDFAVYNSVEHVELLVERLVIGNLLVHPPARRRKYEP